MKHDQRLAHCLNIPDLISFKYLNILIFWRDFINSYPILQSSSQSSPLCFHFLSLFLDY